MRSAAVSTNKNDSNADPTATCYPGPFRLAGLYDRDVLSMQTQICAAGGLASFYLPYLTHSLKRDSVKKT